MALINSFVFLCLMFIYGANGVLKTTFIEDLCLHSKTADINANINLRYESSGILMSAPRHLTEDFQCTIIIQPDFLNNVVLSIYRYDLDVDDKLTIEDDDRFKIQLLGRGFFSDEKKSFFSKGKMTIYYQRSNSSAFNQRAGFQMTYTKTRSSPCRSNEFQCRNGNCIPMNIACDGHNHCGDNSDQNKCIPQPPSVTTESTQKVHTSYASPFYGAWIVTLIVGVVVLFIVVVVFIAMVVKYRKTKKAAALQSGAPEQPSASAPPVEGESFYNRVRRSLRRSPQPRVESEPKQESYEVPSMYPTIPASENHGRDNPSFTPHYTKTDSP